MERRPASGATPSMGITFANNSPRCFLFLVNYSRMKPEVAMKALPILVDVWEFDAKDDTRKDGC